MAYLMPNKSEALSIINEIGPWNHDITDSGRDIDGDFLRVDATREFTLVGQCDMAAFHYGQDWWVEEVACGYYD